MFLPSVPLEDWMRDWYFEARFDLGSSGAPPITLGALRERLGLPQDLLDGCALDDSDTRGALGLRQALARRHGDGDPERVLVGSGSNEVLFFLMSALLGPGDDVLVLDPIYHMLCNVAAARGARLRPFRLEAAGGFRVDVEALCAAIRPETRAVVVNFPHMPTGVRIDAAEQARLVAACRAVGALLIWDGALMDTLYVGDPIASPALAYDRALLIGTLSKSYGLPGLRVGWALGDPALLRRVDVWKDHTSLYVSPLLERVAQAVIERADALLGWRLAQARQNRATLARWLAGRTDVVAALPDGGFTAFPRLLQVPDVDAFCRRLVAEQGVMLVPGSCFGHPQHVRLGFGAPAEVLEEGLARLGRALDAQAGPARVAAPAAPEDGVPRLRLSAEERGRVCALLDGIDLSADDPAFLERAPALAGQLPMRLQEAVHRFRLREEGLGALVISGLPVDDDALGPTPPHWNLPPATEAVRRQERLLILISALLGEPFAWTTQQAGRLIHNVLPIAAHAHEQVGFSSETALNWHTEDAFHELRPDHLALLCLRNPDGVATLLGSAQQLDLPPEVVEALFRPAFIIRPDNSHLAGHRVDSQVETAEVQAARDRMDRLDDAPPPVALLSGDPRDPYLRVDYDFTEALNPEAAAALAVLQDAVAGALFDLVLQPGELALMDNHRVVHGRRSFTARYDGTDRWLKRVNITRDLRRSRAHRADARSRSLL